MTEKLKRRTIRLSSSGTDPSSADSAAQLLRNAKGVLEVRITAPSRLAVTYNVRQITMQIIEALLVEFDYRLDSGLLCRIMRGICYYLEDIECTECRHDQAECTRDAFITRYLRRPHGCRDQRPDYLRRYL